MSQTPTTMEEALAENARLRSQVQRLEEMVARLEARLNQDSQEFLEAAVDRSSGGEAAAEEDAERPEARRSARTHGEPPGAAATEKVDEVEHHWPTACEKCGSKLPARTRTEVGEPQRHQVVEIPAVQAHVTEHQMHTQCCDACGHATQADLPEGVPPGAFGPRLQAVIALFTGAYRVSKRVAESALSDLFGVKLSLGSVSASEQTMSAALATPVAERARTSSSKPWSMRTRRGGGKIGNAHGSGLPGRPWSLSSWSTPSAVPRPPARCWGHLPASW